jgi:uncharacterized RDD family membrane protein YckC
MKTVQFETSQYVSVEFEIAPSGLRIVASLFDMFIIIIYELIVGFILGVSIGGLGGFGGYSLYVIFSFFLLSIPFLFYSPIFEYFTNGKSLGKMVCGIRVVRITGENAGFKEYFTRWLFRVPDLWLTSGFVGLFFASSSKEGQRLGDMMANTVVINTKTNSGISLARLVGNLQQSEEVTYANLTQFTDAEMLLIKKVNERYKMKPTPQNKALVLETADHMSKILGLEPPQKPLQFLTNLVQDYVVQTR